MLRTELIDLVNKGDVWAFIGAGASVDAGAPTWPQLLDRVIEGLPETNRTQIVGDPRFIAAKKASNFPNCFSRVQHFIGRRALETQVRVEIFRHPQPGELLKEIANWPFAGYVTTNYDRLVRKALQRIGQDGGWAEVGNCDSEIRKISGDAERLIWHLHGSVDRSDEQCKLVLAEEDYDAFYLESSRVANQLRSLLTQRRIVFIGFSFEDAELKRLLKIAALYCNPAQPAFAFLAGLDGPDGERKRIDLLERHNVDVIPYEIVNDSHKRLIGRLRVYGSFILKRDQKFGQPRRACPSYHVETTSLLVYNKLAAAKALDIEGDTLGSLLKARVVSLLRSKGPQTFEALTNDLAERIRILKGVPTDDIEGIAAFIQKQVKDLVARGLVENTDPIRLTENGADLSENQAAAAQTLHQQFASSLEERARRMRGDDESSVRNIAKAAEGFFAECIQRRALGVAMAVYAPDTKFKQYHMLALLQSLPHYLEQLDNMEEALALVDLIQGFLAQPTEAESKYLGVALQASFSVTLLGYDHDLVQSRVKQLSSTMFLIDASMLIHILARSSVGHAPACSILGRLKQLGARLATTERLVTEVAEHARWAREHIKTRSGLTPEVLIAVTGHAGLHENLFLDGFLHEVTEKGKSFDFDLYLDSVCDDPAGHTATDEVFRMKIEKMGIPVRDFENWHGFTNRLYGERDEIADKIAERRRGRQTFKHDRQVQAEAEALIIVEKLRDQSFSVHGSSIEDAYFISNTRAIDQVKTVSLPVTMKPDSVLQWVSTLTLTETSELSGLVNALLWEMSENGYTVVDKKYIQNTFSPLISASESDLREELAANRTLVANRYGESATKAFSELSGIEVPVVLHSIYAQRASDLQQQLKAEVNAKDQALAVAKLSNKEREEYERLKARQKQKHLRAKSKQRAGKSSKHKKKKQRKKH